VINWLRRLGARLRGKSWHPETLVCSRYGHVLPAAEVARLRPQDAGLGIDLPDGRRLAKCMRCDSWREVPIPVEARQATLRPLEQIRVPRRGEALREAIIVRIIALDRVVHVVIFGLLFTVALLFRLNIGPLHDQAKAILDALRTTASNSSAGASQGFIVTELGKLLSVRSAALDLVLITALAYFILELVEAIGLWHEKRWAEYLTAVATSGLLPLEILELTKRITVIRVGALVINIAIVVWLLYRKRLFGIAGGGRSLEHRAQTADELFGPPPAAGSPRAPAEATLGERGGTP
jgi:uncharacterized membrane protein (DUF2068 family)